MKFLLLLLLPLLSACGRVPAAILADLQSQAGSIGVRHERPVIDADRPMWIIGTKFYHALGDQVFLLAAPVKVPAGYSGYPVHREPVLTIPSSPGWYCIIYAPAEGRSCLSRAVREGDTVHLPAVECRQSCTR